MIRRREFITLLGGAAAGWPLAAPAQQGWSDSFAPVRRAERTSRGGIPQRTAESYVEGRNVAVESDDKSARPYSAAAYENDG